MITNDGIIDISSKLLANIALNTQSNEKSVELKNRNKNIKNIFSTFIFVIKIATIKTSHHTIIHLSIHQIQNQRSILI